ncbi:hypothetical protein C8Q80DRAFT_1274909 [Daedaleopsis nitida]|nr:hypothetical protein C8Q80DRAFT_1274909 [Daedaleopsis nitida]
MPFHFQLNAIYMLFRTHLGFVSVHDPSSLHHHQTILRRLKLDPKKPEYNKAKELLNQSLIARLMDCARLILSWEQYHSDTAKWRPSWQEFQQVVAEITSMYTTTRSAHDALERGDEVLAHSIFFIRDALIFTEFCDAIRDADAGRMWLVYDFWIFMMRGAGCHNYGNELLEMKAQYTYELPPLLREVLEHTWLVNRWGQHGHQ